MRGMSLVGCLLVLIGTASPTQAQPSLGAALKDIEVAEHWIYDDLPQAVAQAKRTGKPLLVVLRCVPCPPGKTLDQAVATPTSELAELEKQFVCVRIIKTNGLDLDVFQYDFDMSWAAVFLNAKDMTIYGRYGTRYATGPGSDANLSAAAFQKAAERALALHQEYPANKSVLAAKRGKPVTWKKPEQTPGLTDRQGVEVTRQNCIHCHMVKEHALRTKWLQGKLTEDDLFVYPAPQQIGLTLDTADGLVVEAVRADSPAAAAGIKVGDRITTAGGQPLVSTADLVWVLNGTAHQAKVPLQLRRGEDNVDVQLDLKEGWRRSDIAWRASSWFALRQGFKTQPMADDAKRSRGLDADKLALEVIGVFGRNPVLQQSGLKKGDVILAIDGRTAPLTESDFLVQLRTKYGPRDSVKLTILRGGQRADLNVALW